MKKLINLFAITALLFGTLFSTAATADAAVLPSQTEIIVLENGDYIETSIIDIPTISSGTSTLSTARIITKGKTAKYKNSSGNVLWSVTIKATFSYDGTTSKCTACTHMTTCPSPLWKIKSVSSSKSGNSATAKATATFDNSGNYTKYVTISCSKNGTIS